MDDLLRHQSIIVSGHKSLEHVQTFPTFCTQILCNYALRRAELAHCTAAVLSGPQPSPKQYTMSFSFLVCMFRSDVFLGFCVKCGQEHTPIFVDLDTRYSNIRQLQATGGF